LIGNLFLYAGFFRDMRLLYNLKNIHYDINASSI
jgi:hypothetical protein